MRCVSDRSNYFLFQIPFDPQESIAECVAGLIGAIIFGTEFDRRDPFIKQVMDQANCIGNFLENSTKMDNLPGGKWIFKGHINGFLNAIQPTIDLTEKHIDAHQTK